MVQRKKIILKAITLAFNEDHSVLVEEFMKGTEYRFFVLNDQVLCCFIANSCECER